MKLSICSVFGGILLLSDAFSPAIISNGGFLRRSSSLRAQVGSSALGKALSVKGGSIKPPAALYEGAADAGAAKAANSASNIFKLGMLSGAHIGFGAYLMLSIGGQCGGLAASNPGLHKLLLGAFGLPFGLMMTLATGAELFTGNTALVTLALKEGKTSWANLRKSWVFSYLGNLVGSVILAYLMFQSGTLGSSGTSVAIAVAKTSAPFMTALIKGILCNWLVCMAVYMASGASSLPGKMVAIFFPISAFVSMGFEHSVANMFLLPLGMLRGAEITIADMFIKNIIPVTIGNIIGGAGAVAIGFHSAFGSKKSE